MKDNKKRKDRSLTFMIVFMMVLFIFITCLVIFAYSVSKSEYDNNYKVLDNALTLVNKRIAFADMGKEVSDVFSITSDENKTYITAYNDLSIYLLTLDNAEELTPFNALLDITNYLDSSEQVPGLISKYEINEKENNKIEAKLGEGYCYFIRQLNENNKLNIVVEGEYDESNNLINGQSFELETNNDFYQANINLYDNSKPVENQ